MSAITHLVTSFAADLQLDKAPRQVVDRAILALRDFLGISLAEADSPLTQRLLRVANLSGGSGTCQIPGREERLSPFWGAAVLGTSTHHAELDDGHRGGHVHPGVTTIPALLMDAQRRPTAGTDLLSGLIASYEVSIRIGTAISPGAQYERGFHIPGLVGTIGSAIGVSRMRRLDQSSVEQALGASVLGPLAPFAAFSSGAAVKDFYGGWPAGMGILSNDLAAEGIPGPPGLFDDSMGWLTTVGATAQTEGFGDDLGSSWRILETYVKVHAACSFSHTPIDAALELHPHGTTAEDIAEVVVATHVFADRLDDTAPRTPQGARFSIPWVVAAALLRGRVAPEDSSQVALDDPTLRQLAKRVRVISDDEATRRHLEDDRVRPARVEVRYTNGSTRSAARSVGRGGPEQPLSETEVHQRFTTLLQGYDGDSAEQVWDACGQICRPDGVPTLIRTLSKMRRK